ncbi:MAG: hypothetical protein LUE93_01875 [Bacteroides sp.]|nr:hypothetical protein [Bacteroides sp.]
MRTKVFMSMMAVAFAFAMSACGSKAANNEVAEAEVVEVTEACPTAEEGECCKKDSTECCKEKAEGEACCQEKAEAAE